MLMNWTQVEKRISELIKMDRYLNSKEKEYYVGRIFENTADGTMIDKK